MLGGRLKPLDHELHEPPEPDTHRTTDPAQRDSFQQQSFNQRTLLLGNQMIFWIADKGPATHFAAVILFAGMNVTISFIPCGSTLGTCFSHDHSTYLGLPLPILVLAKSSRNLTRALPGSHYPSPHRIAWLATTCTKCSCWRSYNATVATWSSWTDR